MSDVLTKLVVTVPSLVVMGCIVWMFLDFMRSERILREEAFKRRDAALETMVESSNAALHECSQAIGQSTEMLRDNKRLFEKLLERV